MEGEVFSEKAQQAKTLMASMNMRQLNGLGIGRWDEEYYLAGLYHPLRHMKPIDDDFNPSTALVRESVESAVDVYIHVPFCHVSCSFCHFYKEIINRNRPNELEASYIDSLLKEVQNYTSLAGSSLAPQSIQFGGGTPSALSAAGLERLLNGLHNIFDMREVQEVKFEFHPDMASNIEDYRLKLQILNGFGLTTAIIDLEASSPDVLKSICRGNTSTDGFRKLTEAAKEEGVASVASAYMTGLPLETLATFEQTISFLKDQKSLDAINIYPLMFKPSDAVFQQRRLNPTTFCTPEDKDLMFLMASSMLESSGFSEGPCHFFRRQKHQVVQQTNKAKSRTLIGLGPASFGYLNGRNHGLQYMNFPDLGSYSEAIERGNTGMWRASCLNGSQKALRALMFAMNSYENVPIDMFEEAKAAREPGELEMITALLTSLDLLVREEKTIAFSKKGRLRNAEITFYLAEPDTTRWNVDDPEYGRLRRYEFFPSISKDNQLLFKSALNKTKEALCAT